MGGNDTMKDPIAKVKAAKTPEDLESAVKELYQHAWEHRVFHNTGYDLTPELRKKVVYEGFWWNNETEKKPYFITRTSVTDPEGRRLEWSARRQRFGLPLIHEVQEKHRFHWFSWIRFWQFKSIDEQLGWWSAFLFWWGGLMFAISGISGSIRSVLATQKNGRWTTYAWLDGYTSIAGTDLFFLPGVIMVLIQTGNSNLAWRIDRWEHRGCKGPKPKYRWFLPFNRHSLMSWASWIMLSGKICFSTAFTAFGLSTSIYMSIVTQRYLIWVVGTYGSVCFAVFGYAQGLEASSSFYKAILPVFPSTMHSLNCWSGCMGLWGGILFTLGSAGFLATVGIDGMSNYGEDFVFNFVGYCLGSVCFMMSSHFQWWAMTNPQYR